MRVEMMMIVSDEAQQWRDVLMRSISLASLVPTCIRYPATPLK